MTDTESDIKDEILNLDQKDQIVGEIYKIVNTVNNKCYVGQVVSHRLNKNKYRPFGYVGRFSDHVSEAINNTKKKQCTYLNNAIRKYGKEKFKVTLLETCDMDDINDREKHHVAKHKTLYPTGYNLTPGGKTTEYKKVKNSEELNEVKKRGREFGYVHKKSTLKLMSKRNKAFKSTPEQKKITSDTMRKYYDNKKIQLLQEYDLSGDVDDYIHPVMKKDTDIIHKYIIKIDGRKFRADTKDEPLEDQYERLKNIILQAKELQE
jgi:hypothetical protein